MADENNKITEKTIELNEKKAQGLLDLARLEEQAKKAIGEEAELLKEKIKLQEAINAGEQESFKAITKSIAAIEEKIKAQDELNKTLEAATALGKSFGDSIFGLDSKLLNAVKSAGGLTEAFNAFAAGVEEASKQSSVFDVGLDSTLTGFSRLGKGTLAAVSALDSAGASFVQSTGASRDFARAAFETRDSLGLMGISGAEAVGVMGDLYSNFSEFSELSRGSQQDFIELSAQIEKLGGDAAGMAQTFTKVAGMSLAETETAMREVAGAADALGIPFSQMSADLVGMGELFAKMGDGALDVFLELQAAAKATGMSVQSLYNIVGQYDTFEASSQAAGRLNMVLGGNLLDTYSLLNATEEERIDLLQRAMEQSSLTFDEMDRFQKAEISSALGISLEEASQLFGTTRGEVQKTAAELMHAGMSAEELADRTRDASTALDKFEVLMGNLAILVGPIVEGINFIIDGFLSLSEEIGSTGAAVLFVLGGIGLAMIKAAATSVIFGLRMKLAGKVAGEAGVKMAAGVNSVGKAASVNALGILALGAAVALVGVGIGAAAFGFSFLVEQFKEMTPGQILATSVAFVALAGGIGLLALALSSMANPLAATGLLVLGGIGAILGLAVLGVVSAINALEETKVESFAGIISSMKDLASITLAGTGISAFIKDVGEALDELPDNTEKTVAFKATADSLANLMQIGSSVEAEQLERIKMIIDAVSNSEGAESTNRLAAAINSLVRGQANNEGTTNTIELDGRVLARWIDKHDTTRFRAAIGD